MLQYQPLVRIELYTICCPRVNKYQPASYGTIQPSYEDNYQLQWHHIYYSHVVHMLKYQPALFHTLHYFAVHTHLLKYLTRHHIYNSVPMLSISTGIIYTIQSPFTNINRHHIYNSVPIVKIVNRHRCIQFAVPMLKYQPASYTTLVQTVHMLEISTVSSYIQSAVHMLQSINVGMGMYTIRMSPWLKY